MITDEELMAFVDGELDEAARARVHAAIDADPALAARVEAQRALGARLHAHFDPVLEESPPRALVEPLEAGAASASRRPRWRWQEWSAIAATLVIGLLLGPYVMRSSQPLPFLSAGGRVVAIGGLEQALMHRASGEEAGKPGAWSIGLSFRTHDGIYCRTFSLSPGPAGLACREWGEWVVEVLARNPKARQGGPDTYVQAGTAFPEIIREAVESRIKGEPLDEDEERALVQRSWRQ